MPNCINNKLSRFVSVGHSLIIPQFYDIKFQQYRIIKSTLNTCPTQKIITL